MAEMHMDYLVPIREPVTSMEEKTFRGLIKDKCALQVMMYLSLAKSNDQQILSWDKKDKEGRMKILVKMEKEKDKIIMYELV
jgi:hypothetical protein